MMITDGRRTIARNRRARHDHAIEAADEVGLVLTGIATGEELRFSGRRNRSGEHWTPGRSSPPW